MSCCGPGAESAILFVVEEGKRTGHHELRSIRQRSLPACDVIEHVRNPGAFLRAVRQRLVPGGIVFIATPMSQTSIAKPSEPRRMDDPAA